MMHQIKSTAGIAARVVQTIEKHLPGSRTLRRKIVLLAIVNLLAGVNVWAAVLAPSKPVATSTCSNSVTLTWVDPNSTTALEKNVVVLRSTRSPSKGYSTIATLPPYTTVYIDDTVVPAKTYYYKVATVNSAGKKFNSPVLTVTTPSAAIVTPLAADLISDVGGNNFILTVEAGTNCNWDATTADDWISLESGVTGTGTGAVAFAVAENTTSNTRTGAITVARQSAKVTQAGKACAYTVTPASFAFGDGATNGVFAVSTASGCKWTATAVDSWLQTTSTGNGGGNGTFTVAANTTTVARTGSINISGTSLVVTQAGIPVYTMTASAAPANGGSVSGAGDYPRGSSVSLTAVAAGCYTFLNWTEGASVVSTSAIYTFTATASRTLVANFSQITYSITTSSAPSAGGTTTGGGVKGCGNSVTVTATPNAGYGFSNWTEGGTVVSTAASYTFTASANRALVANFIVLPSYAITTSSSPTAGGSTSGGGSKLSGTTATVVATANSCYQFVNWTEGTTVVSTSASYSFTVTGNRTLVANFSQPTYTITTSAAPTAGGTTSGGGSKVCGSSVTLTATANSGYTFVNWTEGASVVSTSATYTFTATGSRTLVANFTALPSYTITTSSSPTAGGSTSGGGSKLSGTTATVVATANSCYQFVNWTEGATVVSTSASYSFTVAGNRTLVANFSQPSYTITTSAAPTAGGTTSGGGSKVCGSSVTLTATANSGYTFVNWTEGATVVSSSASYTFTATGNRTLVANFSSMPTYTVSTSSSPTAGGSTSGGATYVSGATATVVATANSCYQFVNWTEGATVVSTSASYSFTVAGNRTLVANFSQPSYTISTSVAPTAGGTVTGGGTKTCGSSVTLNATPNTGYLFANWTEGGTVVSTSASYTFTATGNRTLVANFALDPVITTVSSPASGGTTTGGGMYLPGVTVTVTATPNAGYSFVNWTEGTTVLSASASYTFTTGTSNRTLVANFATTTFSPTLVGFVAGLGNIMDVAVASNKAYLASDTFGLSIANVANPSMPALLGSSDTPFLGRSVAVRGNRAIVSGSENGLVKLYVLDLTDATHPALLGELPTTVAVNTGGTGYQGVALNSNATLAVAAMGVSGLYVINLSNPATPTLLGTYNTPGQAYSVVLNTAGTLAYVADGLGHLQIVNITTPSAPTLAGSLNISGNQVDIDIVGNTVYLANLSGTLQIVDVSNPAAPVYKGASLLSGGAAYVAVEGTRAAVISVTTNEYLDVVDVTNPAAPVRSGTVLIGSPGSVKGLALTNGQAYVAANTMGMKIYNVTVATPTVSGTLDDTFEARSCARVGNTALIAGKDVPTGNVRFKVVNLTNPAQPSVIGELATALPVNTGGTAYQGVALTTNGALAVAALGTTGIQIISLSNPAAPTVLGTYNTPGQAYAVKLNAAGTLAYVADGLGHLQIVNIATPSAPTLAGSLNISGNQVDIDIVGNIAYLANLSGTLQIVDVSNPAAPVYKGASLLSGGAAYVSVESNRAIVVSVTTNEFLDVVDVTNPAAPVRGASVTIGAPGTAKGLTYTGNRAYVAATVNGLYIYEVSNPAAPALIYTGGTIGSAFDVTVGGGWATVADSPATISLIDLVP